MTDRHPPRLAEQQRADRAECAALLRAALPEWGKRRTARAAAMIVDDVNEARSYALWFSGPNSDAERALYDFCAARGHRDDE